MRMTHALCTLVTFVEVLLH